MSGVRSSQHDFRGVASPYGGAHGAFKTVFQMETKNNILSGITLFAWLSVLWRRKYDIEFATYWPRLLFITIMSINNSFVSSIEHFIYGKAIQRQELNDRPVFILGHPRTGTTHLFNLLSLDSKFAYTNTFQAGFPSGFLLLERFKVYLKNVVDNKRPMDNMALTLVCKFSFPKPLMENFF